MNVQSSFLRHCQGRSRMQVECSRLGAHIIVGYAYLARFIHSWIGAVEQDLNLGFLQGIFRKRLRNSKARIPPLPSWSWTGSSDAVSYDEFPAGLNSVLQVSVELRDGSVLDWNEFQCRYTKINNPVQLSYFIQVWAPAFEIYNRSENDIFHNLEVKMNDSWFLRWMFHCSQYDLPR